MEEIALKTILQALKEHSGQVNEKFVSLEKRVEKLEEKVEDRFDRFETKVDFIRFELSDTQETLDFITRKTLKHEKKLKKSVNDPTSFISTI